MPSAQRCPPGKTAYPCPPGKSAYPTAMIICGSFVIADRTNLNTEGLRRLEALGARLVIHDLRNVRLADCLARDAARPSATRVGADGIRALANRWL